MKKVSVRCGILPFIFSSILMVAVPACSKKYYFTTSTIVPAAQGQVQVKKDKNNNYDVAVNVIHLADPKRLSPPSDTYVVWAETGNRDMKNLGRITISSGMFSRTLKGSLRTVTTFRPTKVFITGESDGPIDHPGEPVVLTTAKF